MQQYSLQRVKKWYNNQYFVFKYYWNNLWVKTSVGPRAHKGSFVRTQEFLVTYRYIYYGTVNTKPVQIPVDLLSQKKYQTKGHKGPLIIYMAKIYFHYWDNYMIKQKVIIGRILRCKGILGRYLLIRLLYKIKSIIILMESGL